MSTLDAASVTAAGLADPTIDASTLGRVASLRPDLWNVILHHRNCYVELAEWIRQNQQGQVAPPGPAVSEAQWMAQFQGTYRREPTMGEYQAARAAGQIQPVPGAAGTPGFPQAWPVVNAAPAGAAGGAHWMTWTAPAMVIVVFLMAISLFMPMFSVTALGQSYSPNFFDADIAGAGVFVLLTLIVLMSFAVVSLLGRQKWARITTGVLGIIAGLVAALVSLTLAAGTDHVSKSYGRGGSDLLSMALSSTVGVSMGAGTVLLGNLALVLIIASIISFFPQAQRN